MAEEEMLKKVVAAAGSTTVQSEVIYHVMGTTNKDIAKYSDFTSKAMKALTAGKTR